MPSRHSHLRRVHFLHHLFPHLPFTAARRTLSPLFVLSSALQGRSAYVFATFCSLICPSGPLGVHFRLFLFAHPPFRTARSTLSSLFVPSSALQDRSAYIFVAFCPLSCPLGPLGARFRLYLFAQPSYCNSQPTFSAFFVCRGDLAGRCFFSQATRPKAGRQAVRAAPWSAGADRVTRWTTQSSLPSRRKTFSGSPGR